jgi:threonyl-tRNA synthetase
MKIPYQIVIGDKEVEDKSVTYRKYGSQEQTTVSLKEFIKQIKEEIKLRK